MASWTCPVLQDVKILQVHAAKRHNRNPIRHSRLWVVHLIRDNRLVLGPFQGKSACIHIAKGKGVCGSAWERDETLVVPDVHAFPGHIACDSQSESEIVIPLHKDGEVFGVLDIDSPIKDRFQEADKAGLESFAKILERMQTEYGSCERAEVFGKAP